MDTYAERMSIPEHRSMFRDRLARRAGPRGLQEFLVDQANLRGFLGAFSNRADLGTRDESLALEDILVAFLQPQAPVEVRVLKLVVRMLQSGRLDLRTLLLRARRERADAVLAWIVGLIPEAEHNEHTRALEALLEERPPREVRRPVIDYDPTRLIRRRAKLR